MRVRGRVPLWQRRFGELKPERGGYRVESPIVAATLPRGAECAAARGLAHPGSGGRGRGPLSAIPDVPGAACTGGGSGADVRRP